MILDTSQMPEGWFLFEVRHIHTPIVHAGDKHAPVKDGPWSASIQHVTGGKLQNGRGDTPQAALAVAVKAAYDFAARHGDAWVNDGA